MPPEADVEGEAGLTGSSALAGQKGAGADAGATMPPADRPTVAVEEMGNRGAEETKRRARSAHGAFRVEEQLGSVSLAAMFGERAEPTERYGGKFFPAEQHGAGGEVDVGDDALIALYEQTVGRFVAGVVLDRMEFVARGSLEDRQEELMDVWMVAGACLGYLDRRGRANRGVRGGSDSDFGKGGSLAGAIGGSIARRPTPGRGERGADSARSGAEVGGASGAGGVVDRGWLRQGAFATRFSSLNKRRNFRSAHCAFLLRLRLVSIRTASNSLRSNCAKSRAD